MSVFERIKKLSEKRGISLQKVAEDNDFSSNLIYRRIKSDPKGKDLAKIADYFHVTTDYILGLTDNPSIPTSTDKRRLTWRDLGQSYGGDDPVPDDFQSLVDSLAEGYFKSHPELRKKNNDD